MVSGFLGKEVPVFRLRVRISCYPLDVFLKGLLFPLRPQAFYVTLKRHTHDLPPSLRRLLNEPFIGQHEHSHTLE